MHTLLSGILANALALGGRHGRLGTLIGAGVVLAMAQAPAAQGPRIAVMSGGAPTIAEIIAYSVDAKSLGMTGADGVLEFNPRLLTEKNVSIAAGTPMVIYSLACQDDKIRVVMAPQSTSTQDIGCANAAEPIVEGQNCRCDRVAGGPWGSNFTVSVPSQEGGMSMPKVLTYTGIGVGALAGAAVALSGDDATSSSSSGTPSAPALSTASGTYSLTLNQSATTCVPAGFVASFGASATVVVEDNGSVRVTLIDPSTSFVLTGTVQRTGNTATGTVSGSGTSSAGTPLSVTATLTISLGPPPTLTFGNYVVTNNTRNCNATFSSNTAPRASS